MDTRTPTPSGQPERREAERGRFRSSGNALYGVLRFIARHVRGFWGAIAAFLTLGFAVGAAAAAIFASLASFVQTGFTQRFDERVLRWFETHRSAGLDNVMLEITSLGNGSVLVMLVAITSTFLWLTRHRWSVYILLVGVLGGKLLNTILKESFARPRPSIFEHVDPVSSMSFPSGHAMSSIIAYGSVAYLISRLEPTRGLRITTWVIAALLVGGIGVSRMYLGVHYPSDIIGGFLAGLAWLAFVASTITAVGFFAPRRPETRSEEKGLISDPDAAA